MTSRVCQLNLSRSWRDEMTARPARLADITNLSQSFLAFEAIGESVEDNDWQIAEVHAALNEADQGDFAGDTARFFQRGFGQSPRSDPKAPKVGDNCAV
jgi:predicted transcriptional regulator